MIVGSALAGRLARITAHRRLGSLGLAAVAAGTGVLAATQGSGPGVLSGVVIAGLGLGVAAVGATTVGTDVPDRLAGSAAGILNTGAQLGTAVGVATLLTLSATLQPSTGIPVAWGLAAVAAALTAVGLAIRSRGHA